jgi:hypothetical protein
MPNYATAQSIVFTRASSADASPSSSPRAPGQPPTPTMPPPAAASPPPSASPSAVGATHLEGWNIAFQTPAGWNRGQDLGRIAVYGSNSEAGAIFVTPGLYASFDEVVADVGAAFQAMGMMAQPIEGPTQTTIGGMRAMTSLLASQDQMGRIVQTRVVALLTPHGTGLIVSGMTTPERMQQLRQRVDQLAASMRAQAPAVNQQAVAALAGRWMYFDGAGGGVTSSSGGSSRSVEQYASFDGAGRFEWTSSASVSVTTPSLSSGAGTAGGASSSSDQGTYTVIGSTLVLKGQQGQQAFQLQLLGDRIIADGRTYLRAN